MLQHAPAEQDSDHDWKSVLNWRARGRAAKISMRIAGILLMVASLVWYARGLADHAELFRSIRFDRETIMSILFGVVLYPAIYVAGAIIWVCVLRSLGSALSWKAASSVCLVAQIGKYLPGNVAHHVGRLVLARRCGLTTERVMVSMFIETANLIACGSLIASFVLVDRDFLPAAVFGYLPSLSQLACLIAIAIFAAAIGAQFCRRSVAASNKRRDIQPRWLLFGVAIQLFVFFVHGAIACALLLGVFQVGLEQVSLFAISGLFAAAWIAGFVTPGAPAGIGIRETVITLTLGPVYGAPVAIGLAAFMRVVSTLGDGLSMAVGLLIMRAQGDNYLSQSK